MSKHLERDLESLEQRLLAMSAAVEGMIVKAWRSLSEKNERWAAEVIAADASIDEQEVHIEEECLKILALHQPVAIDLRRTATILKVNNDLERIADLAVNIAERGQRLSSATEFELPKTLHRMADLSRNMLSDALTSLVQLAPVAALQVCAADDEVDRCNDQIAMELCQAMTADPRNVGPGIHCLVVARHLERMGDLATNIAEDVVYLVRGDIARHRHSAPSPIVSAK